MAPTEEEVPPPTHTLLLLLPPAHVDPADRASLVDFLSLLRSALTAPAHMHLLCSSQVEAMNEQAFAAAESGNEEAMAVALVNGANANSTDSVSAYCNDTPPLPPAHPRSQTSVSFEPFSVVYRARIWFVASLAHACSPYVFTFSRTRHLARV